MPGKHAPAEERFWRHVALHPTGCWEWTAGLNSAGYGQFKPVSRMAPDCAHRFSWLLHFGPIPAGLFVCHRCDNPRCVRPDHLFLGTSADNMRDAIRKGRRGRAQARWIRATIARVRKLSPSDIAEARRRHAAGESCRSIARSFNVAHTTITRLINGTQWANAL